MRKNQMLFLSIMVSCGILLADHHSIPFCAESVIEVDIDQSTDLGFSARDLLNLASGERELAWDWDYKEDATLLEIRSTSIASKARYIDSVAVYPDGAVEIGIICPDRLEVDAWISFATQDGGFSERWYTKIYDTDGTDCMPETGDPCLAPGTEAKFNYEFNRESLNGTFYSDVAVPEELTVDFSAEGRFTKDSAFAIVHGRAYSCSDDACYAYYIHGGHTR